MVDKDFDEIATMVEVLPDAFFIICRFHAIDAVKKKLNSLKIPKEVHDQLTELFQKMVYAISPEQYDENANHDVFLVLVNDTHADKCDGEAEEGGDYDDLL